MLTKLFLPNIPNSPLYENDDEGSVLTVEWHEFFRSLFERVGGEDVTGLSDVALALLTNTFNNIDVINLRNRVNELEKIVSGIYSPSTSEAKEDLLNEIIREPFKYFLPQPVWKDENFSGFSAGANAGHPDEIQWDGGNIYVDAFDGSATTQQLFAGTELQHDYWEGSDFHFHVHWAPTTAAAGNVKWNIDYTIERDGTGTIDSGTLSETDSADGTAWLPKRTDFSTSVSGASFKVEDQIAIRLYRDPSDVADTYAADAVLAFTFGYHYQIDAVGSRLIGSK